jgi:peptidyl-prolyl cis-trans isomerase SurA
VAGALLAALLGALPAAAQRERIDRVVAQVDDEAILLSDVLREMDLVRLQRNLGALDAGQQEELYRQVLASMIDDQLLVAQAKTKGFEVGEGELTDAVDEQIRAIKQRLGGEEAYRAELQRQGLTEVEVRDMHRDQRRKQILAMRVIQTEVRTGISITIQQVREFYESQRDSVPPELLRTPETVRLADILIAPRVDDSQMQDALARINLAARRIENGEDFATVASEVSEWPTARSGGSLGKFRYGDFDSERFDEAVSKLEPGEVSDVVETKFGLMIVKLESRDGDVMSARHIVVKTSLNEDAKVDALNRAMEIRRRILAGESFQDLARLYSDDPLTKDQGGALEDAWAISELRPQFRAAIDSVDVGEISEIVNTPNGFYLFKVLQRTQSEETSYEQIEAPLRRYLESRALERKYREYVTKLRSEFYVDIKDLIAQRRGD